MNFKNLVQEMPSMLAESALLALSRDIEAGLRAVSLPDQPTGLVLDAVDTGMSEVKEYRDQIIGDGRLATKMELQLLQAMLLDHREHSLRSGESDVSHC